MKRSHTVRARCTGDKLQTVDENARPHQSPITQKCRTGKGVEFEQYTQQHSHSRRGGQSSVGQSVRPITGSGRKANRRFSGPGSQPSLRIDGIRYHPSEGSDNHMIHPNSLVCQAPTWTYLSHRLDFHLYRGESAFQKGALPAAYEHWVACRVPNLEVKR